MPISIPEWLRNAAKHVGEGDFESFIQGLRHIGKPDGSDGIQIIKSRRLRVRREQPPVTVNEDGTIVQPDSIPKRYSKVKRPDVINPTDDLSSRPKAITPTTFRITDSDLQSFIRQTPLVYRRNLRPTDQSDREQPEPNIPLLPPDQSE